MADKFVVPCSACSKIIVLPDCDECRTDIIEFAKCLSCGQYVRNPFFVGEPTPRKLLPPTVQHLAVD